jgi:protoheme ferro-lyase
MPTIEELEAENDKTISIIQEYNQEKSFLTMSTKSLEEIIKEEELTFEEQDLQFLIEK